MRAFFALSFAGLIGLIGVAACGSNDIEGSELDNAELNAESSLFALGVGGDGCGVPIPNLGEAFLGALPDCGIDKSPDKPNGVGGKCVPASPLTPASVTKLLSPCPSGTCIPLTFLQANTKPLVTCTSYGKSPGVCVSRVVPTLDKLTFLPKDVCQESERCAPCANPTDGKETGLCDIGKPPKKPADQCKASKEPPTAVACPYKGPPVLDVSKLTPCAPKGMHCLPKTIVPEAFAAQLAPCDDAAYLCAPDNSIEANGQFVAKTCDSIGNAEGRCLNERIPQVAAQSKFLPVATCQPFERCIPCFDPLTGEKLPTCSISCDPGPTKKAYVFSKCQGEKGRCVPVTAIPADMQKQLKDTDCKAGEELCAPVTAMDRNAKPQKCLLKYLGIPRPASPAVCIEDVLSIGIALNQSDCKDDFKCTPCINPLGGEPTNLPGCPK